MTLDKAIADLVDQAEEWRYGGAAVNVVLAACEVLVAGHDGIAIATLAGVEFSDADDKVSEYVADALAELGLRFLAVRDTKNLT
jgi:hypothetical protein